MKVKMNSLSLIPLVEKPGFAKQMVLIPAWKLVRPEPYEHADPRSSYVCSKCKNDIREVSAVCPIPDPFNDSLAELSFELREKARTTDVFGRALSMVWDEVRVKDFDTNALQNVELYQFWTWYARPEHWIISALLALEMEK